ncbi:hypothetical protein LB465_11490 [Salegentibacter sp. LM13S]|uniref:hypothetical protein n=1 Tax=Salegentibacter lacus TaxID=2873599 RepID=UPI001CCF8F98|nr:hypothetical protein [Salegentibacter lacus]MBZ9631404.1 hypothetical protein [Salegentibacter lacus]
MNQYYIFILFLFLSLNQNLYSQEKSHPQSIRTGIGLSFNNGREERGMGLIYSIGYQKSFGNNNRIRLNPNLIFGGFLPIGITDTRDQFYRISSFGFNLHYDLVKFKSISVVTSPGIFLNYSRGLLGTGGMPEADNYTSEFFNSIYFGGKFSLGLRITPSGKRLAYEIRPLNIQFGNKGFILGYLMFGIDIKLGEN